MSEAIRHLSEYEESTRYAAVVVSNERITAEASWSGVCRGTSQVWAPRGVRNRFMYSKVRSPASRAC